MEPAELQQKRLMIGLISAGCFILATLLYVLMPETVAARASCIRLGIFLGAFWLAIPLLAKHPRILKWFPWYSILVMLAVFAIARHPLMYALYVIPVLLVLGMFSMFTNKRRMRDQ